MYTNCSFGTWVPGRYTEVAFIQGWALRGGSTVHVCAHIKLDQYTIPPCSLKVRRLPTLLKKDRPLLPHPPHTTHHSHTPQLHPHTQKNNQIQMYKIRTLKLKQPHLKSRALSLHQLHHQTPLKIYPHKAQSHKYHTLRPHINPQPYPTFSRLYK